MTPPTATLERDAKPRTTTVSTVAVPVALRRRGISERFAAAFRSRHPRPIGFSAEAWNAWHEHGTR